MGEKINFDIPYIRLRFQAELILRYDPACYKSGCPQRRNGRDAASAELCYGSKLRILQVSAVLCGAAYLLFPYGKNVRPM